MKRSSLLLAISFIGAIAIPASPAEAETVGSAECELATPEAECKLKWDMTGQPRAYYWVQRFDAVSAGWRNVDERATDTTSFSAREEPVEAGSLYRVRACNDSDARVGCIESRMTWAPIIPGGEIAADAIPSTVQFTRRDGSLAKFAVQKDQDLAYQTAQYNVYELIRTLSSVEEIGEFPEMTPPREFVSGARPDASIVDVVLGNVYAAYQGERGQPVIPSPPPYDPELYEYHLPEPD